jgi:hypothetical protein
MTDLKLMTDLTDLTDGHRSAAASQMVNAIASGPKAKRPMAFLLAALRDGKFAARRGVGGHRHR